MKRFREVGKQQGEGKERTASQERSMKNGCSSKYQARNTGEGAKGVCGEKMARGKRRLTHKLSETEPSRARRTSIRENLNRPLNIHAGGKRGGRISERGLDRRGEKKVR